MMYYRKSGAFFKAVFLSVMVAGIFPIVSQAQGGVSLGATRVIYDQSDKQTSLSVMNSDAKTRYLVQSWVEDVQGKKTSDFIITPPLFIINKKSENTLRIINTNDQLPKDRETVYWLNTKAIPEVDKDNVDGKNVLQLAILTRVKIFVRPKNIDMSSSQAPGMLKFSASNGKLMIDNPTPYYVNLVNVSVAGQDVDAFMAAPKGKTTVTIPVAKPGKITYSAVTDFGAITSAMSATVN